MIRNKSGFTPANDALIFKIEDFGAVGDGVTNDGVAFGKAMRALAEADKSVQKVLYLKPDTTYRIIEIGEKDQADRGIHCAIHLVDCENVAIVGDNTSISVKIPCGGIYVGHCKNIHISGIDLGFNPSPMVVGKLTHVSDDWEWFDFEVDMDEDCGLPLGEEVGDLFKGIAFFMVPNDPDIRIDYFLDKLHLVEPGHLRAHQDIAPVKNKIDWYMSTVHVGDEFVIPRLNFGQVLAGGSVTTVSYGDVEGLEMISCHIHDVPVMVMGVGACANVLFKDVHFQPVEGDRNLLVSWRDGYHVKDNYKKIVWEDCTVGMLGDDVYNIATNYREVKEVIDDVTFKMTVPTHLSVGDTIGFLDLDAGILFGQSKIAELTPTETAGISTIKLEEKIDGLEVGRMTQVVFTETNPEGLLVKNCELVGSIRVKAPVTFEDCKIRTSIFYISNEEWYEGPIPTNITLENCDIVSTYPGQAWLDDPVIPTVAELTANMPANNLAVHIDARGRGAGPHPFRTSNIAVRNCRVTGRIDLNGNDVDLTGTTCDILNK